VDQRGATDPAAGRTCTKEVKLLASWYVSLIGAMLNVLYRLLLGIGFLYEGIKYSRKLGQLNFWDKNFRTYGNPSNPYTIEASPGGRRMIFTADAENIKAVLATQFNDYGKGKRFNRVWHDFLGDGMSPLGSRRTGGNTVVY